MFCPSMQTRPVLGRVLVASKIKVNIDIYKHPKFTNDAMYSSEKDVNNGFDVKDVNQIGGF